MTERRRQTEFLKELMQSQDCEECRDLETRIRQAERDERCICSAMIIAVSLALLSLLGLGYSTILAADAGADSSITTLKVFTTTLLASVICLAGLVGFLYSSRQATNHLYYECRTFIRSRHRAQFASREVGALLRAASIVKKDGAIATSETQSPSSSDAPRTFETPEPVPVLAK